MLFPQGPGVQVWSHRGFVAVNPPGAPWASPAPPEFCKNHFVKLPIVSKEKSRKAESTKCSSILVIFFLLLYVHVSVVVFLRNVKLLQTTVGSLF